MSNIYKVIALSVVFFVCINSACAWDWSCCGCWGSDTGVDDCELDIDEAIDHSLGESSFNEYVQLPSTYWFGWGG